MKKLTLALTLVLALLTALSTVVYAATAVRPTEAWNTSTQQFVTTAVKVPATADYEVYLSGTYQHKISVAGNKLLVDGTYRGLRPPYKALLDNIRGLVPVSQYSALSEARSDQEIHDALASLPAELLKKVTPTLKIQLVKPMPAHYKSYYIGSDGLARVEDGGLLLPRTNDGIITTTIPVVRGTAATDIANLKTLGLSLDLAGVADGVYGIQELLSDGTAAHQEGRLWHQVAVVIYNGIASLQVVEDDYGWATTKGGKAIYGEYYPDRWNSSSWRLRVWNGN